MSKRARDRQEELQAWVLESVRSQGIPEKVTDAGVLSRVCVLLGAPATAERGR